MREPAAAPAVPRQPASHVTLRAATLDDLDAVVALEHRCYGRGEAYPRDEYRRLLVGGPHINLLMENDEGRSIAFTGAYTLPGMVSGHVYTVNVDPDHRRRGHATRLLEVLEARLREAGCAASVLEVRVDNTAAVRLYEGRGYERMLRIEGYYPGPGERDAWQYLKEL